VQGGRETKLMDKERSPDAFQGVQVQRKVLVLQKELEPAVSPL